MSDEPVMATTWEECAEHVEQGGVVQRRRYFGDDGWTDEDCSAAAYRSRGVEVAPGTAGWFPRRILPLPAAALEPSVAIEVPEGHELVVLPRDVVDDWARRGPFLIGSTHVATSDACRDAVARRPKPAPETELVPWGDGLIGRSVPQQDQPIDYVRLTRDGIRQYGSMLDGDRWMDVSDPDGMVEVLIEDQS